MLMIISPAKTLDFETPAKTKACSEPEFLSKSQLLIDDALHMAPQDIASLMGISDKLAALSYNRFQNWHTPFDRDNTKQAVLAFKGDVYTGLDAESFKSTDFKFAQKHLRILSGLYGSLRPLDLIQPYRLEMGIKFANQGGKNLYEFWGASLTESINRQHKKNCGDVLINLASNEYFKALKSKQINADIITPVFKDFKNGKYKIISFYAKKARGLMTAYVIKNQISDVNEIKSFDCEGYAFNAAISTAREWVFCREEIA